MSYNIAVKVNMIVETNIFKKSKNITGIDHVKSVFESYNRKVSLSYSIAMMTFEEYMYNT